MNAKKAMMILMMAAGPNTANYSGDGNTTVFPIVCSYTITEIEKILINGVELPQSDYTYLGNNIVQFNTPPQANDSIEIFYI